jgi:hypothetical protein
MTVMGGGDALPPHELRERTAARPGMSRVVDRMNASPEGAAAYVSMEGFRQTKVSIPP